MISLRGLVLAVSLIVSSQVLQENPADAGIQWCSEDPILTFSNGTQIQVLLRYDAAYSSVVADPIVWSIQVPQNIGAVKVTVPTNAAHREQVTLKYTGGKWGGGMNDIQIHATETLFAAGSKFNVELSVYGDTSAKPVKGGSDKPLTIAAHTHTKDFRPYQGVTTGATYTFTGTATVSLP
jgi:hypothetical protein